MADASLVQLATGLIAAGAALAGVGITQRRTQKRDDEQWKRQRADRLRDAQAQLYLDLMLFTNNQNTELRRVLDEEPRLIHDNSKFDVKHIDDLAARVRLYAS